MHASHGIIFSMRDGRDNLVVPFDCSLFVQRPLMPSYDTHTQRSMYIRRLFGVGREKKKCTLHKREGEESGTIFRGACSTGVFFNSRVP